MGKKQQIREAEQAMSHAQTYQEYHQACEYHDELSGAEQWKEQDKSNEYDYQLIRKRLQRIQSAMLQNDPAGLMSILHEGIHGNLGNIANPNLMFHTKTGTKYLISNFLDAVCKALDLIYEADEEEIDFYEKLAFFEETSHSYGQSCLMLSGGAGLGFFHCGVVKALFDQQLLPDVISGASAGSIVASVVATRTDDELAEFLSPELIYEKFSKWSSWNGLLQKGSLLNSEPLENALIELFDLTTFREAYDRTGRHVTVSVSKADLHQYSRLLNVKTSPNAVITQAVRASCAIPYVFSPVQLKAKNQAGEIVPYVPNRKFADGSLMADLPFNRLARLYGVNHSIVSQTNPLAVPFLSRGRKHSNSLLSITKRHVVSMAKTNSIYVCDVLENMVSNKAAKLGIQKVRSIMDQQYVGNINILPERGLGNIKFLLTNPSVEGISELINKAERATWAQIDAIKRSTQISKCFRTHLKKLRQRESELLSTHPTNRVINS